DTNPQAALPAEEKTNNTNSNPLTNEKSTSSLTAEELNNTNSDPYWLRHHQWIQAHKIMDTIANTFQKTEIPTSSTSAP
ncbi:2100_t:CDS:2, partial [Gigaspora margarita]